MRLCTALALPLTLLACTPRPTTSSAPDADASAVAVGTATNRASADAGAPDGAALYASLCSVCHGADATGYKADHAPSLVNATFLESASDEQLRRSIVDGRPGTSMAA